MAALARAGLVLDEPWYLDAARQTAEFLAEKLTTSDPVSLDSRKSTSAAIELPDGMAPSYASFVRVSSCSPLEA